MIISRTSLSGQSVDYGTDTQDKHKKPKDKHKNHKTKSNGTKLTLV